MVERNRLVGDFPKEPSFQSDVAQSLSNQAIARDRKAKPGLVPEGVETAWRAAISINQKLVDVHPHVVVYRVELAHEQTLLGHFLRKHKRYGEAIENYAGAISIVTTDQWNVADNANA